MTAGWSLQGRGWGLGALLVMSACDFNTPAPVAPRGTINYPIAVDVLSIGERRELVVVNSNFTVRFGAGSIQAFDLDTLYATLDADCGETGRPIDGICEQPLRTTGDFPAPTTSTSPPIYEVFTSSAADGIALSPALRDPNSSGPTRLYFPVRSAAGPLAWVDVDSTGAFECDHQVDDGHCGGVYVQYDATVAAQRGLQVPSDPVEVVATRVPGDDENDYLVVVHRGTNRDPGSASLFVHRRNESSAPQLIDVLTNLPPDTISVVLQPGTGLIWLVGDPRTNIRQLVALGIGRNSEGARRLFVDRTETLSGLEGGADLRDIAFEPEPNEERAWLLGRSPNGVIPLDLTRDPPLTGTPEAVIPSPSRLLRIEIAPLPPEESIDPSATYEPHPYLVATSYDEGFVYLIDAATGKLAHTVAGFSGAYELAYDPVGRHLFVADFRDSVVRVVDLGSLAPGAPPSRDELQIRATLGEPYALGVFR